MAEQSKAKLSSTDQKKKNTFLDEEIGDDFLGSWKPMSVLKDDGMDFSFDSGAKSKKKVFDFDKLDMDFNLDSDFSKLSSFKMDMSDFDLSSPHKKDGKTKEGFMSGLELSSPPKKAAKTKEVDMSDLDLSSPPKKAAKTKGRSEEPSRGSVQGKQDHFKFSFDFNELNSFDLDSTLSRRDKSSKSQDSSKEVVPDGAGSEGSKVDLAERINTLDGLSEIMATSKIENMLVDPRNTDSINDCASESESSRNPELPPGPRCQEKLMSKSTEESNQQSHLPMKASIEPYVEQAKHDLTAEHVGVHDSNGDAGVDGKNGGDPEIEKVIAISSEQEADNDKVMIGDALNHEDSPVENSSPLDIGSLGRSADRSISASDTLTENDEPSNGNRDYGENSTTVISRKMPHDIRSIEGTKNSTLILPLSTQASDSTAHKFAVRKESRAGEHCSKISKKLEDTGPQLCQPLLIGAKSLSGNKKLGSIYLRPVIEKGESVTTNDPQHGRNLLSRPVLVHEERKVRPVITERDGSHSEALLNGTNIVGNPQLCNKEVTAKEPVIGSEQRRNLKDIRVQVSPLSSNDKTIKLSSHSLKPMIMLPTVEPIRNSTIITVRGNKLCPDKPADKNANVSNWKMSKNIGGNKVSLNAAPQKEVKSHRSSEQNKELQGSLETETRQIVDGSVKMPQNLPLKRKSFEGLNPGSASLKSLKRLSLSPRETRNFTGPPKETVEQVGTHENHLEIKTTSPSSRLGSPCMMSLMELQLPSAMETDENVEKAEAYTKELEDICNILKKKHEEAKEILVRAVVNNSKLLMLNHPIYEAKISFKIFLAITLLSFYLLFNKNKEKVAHSFINGYIHKVQKFAAKYASKALQAC